MLKIDKLNPSIQDFEKMHDFVAGRAISAAIYVAAKLGIADKLKDGSVHFEQLANDLNVSSDALYRLLRALSGEGIFIEYEDGNFSLTALGATMCSGPNSLADLIVMCGDPWHWTMWGGLIYSIKTGEPYFEKHFNEDFFSYIKESGEVRKGFNAAMSSLSSLSNRAISETFDFSDTKLLVDIGGGQGGLLISILKKHPQLNGILFDLPKTINSAKKIIQSEGLSARCHLSSGDFFKSVPKEGDVYIIKHVFHGLNDDQCISILKNVKKSARRYFRLLIVELIIPEANKPSYSKFNDLGMMLLSKTGRERTIQQFTDLLNRSEMDVISVTPSYMGLSVVEAKEQEK